MGSPSASRPSGHPKPAKRDSLLLLPRPHLPPPENPSNTTGAGDMEITVPGCSSAMEPSSSSSTVPLSIDGAEEDAALHQAGFLSREEVIQRRLRRVRQLEKYYRRQYWALMEAVRVRHRDYYWNYGRGPAERDEDVEGGGGGGGRDGAENGVEGSGENGGRSCLGFGAQEGVGNNRKDRVKNDHRCAFPGCKSKPMALTRYCHPHILSDQEQKLYRPCTYAIKSAQAGPIICGKLVLRAAAISYCPSHFQKAQRHVSQALKKSGLPQNSSRPSPKFHVLIAEFVRQIQSKRIELRRASVEDGVKRCEIAS